MEEALSQQSDQAPQPVYHSYKGVCWAPKYSNWRARIMYRGKMRHVGFYPSKEEAAMAHDKAAVFLHGSKAVTNFGLAACLEDPTEVSSFIVNLKEPGQAATAAANVDTARAAATWPAGPCPWAYCVDAGRNEQQQRPGEASAAAAAAWCLVS
ncbi:hypothetical protein OEZ85_000081 [Tetradesmus obliquus]|uniref:AP2/ERF domain-containing protein n=1 Tax=Tetradesmus obliquus TaxID=3088 RepID=A0ABY8UQV0_TETOB|nr:hypothetical protein OEZ85_000081 [Tetradesmus obliquus]